MAEPPIEDPLLAALAASWDDVMRRADAEGQRRIVELVRRGGEDDPVDARAELAEELIVLLPADHALVSIIGGALLYDGGVGVAEPPDLTVAFRHLRGRVLVGPTSPDPAGDDRGDGSGTGDRFDVEVQSRLLALPGLTRSELADRDVDVAGLIQLPRPDRDPRLPAFQFAPTGRPYQVVRDVNDLLDAARDPWGVTCWWVGVHAGLDARPVDLLATDRDDLVRAAAASSLEDY